MATVKWEAGAITTVLSTELNSLANAAATVLSAEQDNATDLYLFATFELNATFAAAPTANSVCELYIVPTLDGTNYMTVTTGASGAASLNNFVGSFPLTTATAQRVSLGGSLLQIPLPPTKFKVLLINRSGQAMTASGHTVKMIDYRYSVA